MRDLLRREGLAVLGELAGSRTLVALDFDGTLAPIVASRHRARLDAETLRRLDEVARRWPCAVISGRARDDVAARLGGVRLAAVIGNHGAETVPPLRGEAAWRRRVRKWVGRIAGALEGVGGIEVEDKGLSLTLHVRGGPARRTARRALRRLPGAVVVDGKRTLNVLVHGAPGKGRALARLVRRGRYERVLFVGDDGTDEDVFRNPPQVPFAGVVVGRRRGTAAGYHLRSQRDVVRLLARLASLRGGGRPRSRPGTRRPREPRPGPRQGTQGALSEPAAPRGLSAFPRSEAAGRRTGARRASATGRPTSSRRR